MSASQPDLLEAILASSVIDARLAEAFRIIPRAEFVPAERSGVAYEDRPIAIAHDYQVIPARFVPLGGGSSE